MAQNETIFVDRLANMDGEKQSDLHPEHTKSAVLLNWRRKCGKKAHSQYLHHEQKHNMFNQKSQTKTPLTHITQHIPKSHVDLKTLMTNLTD